MGIKKDISGQRFGYLTVISESDEKNNKSRHIKWLCKCDCGKFKVISGNALRMGNIVSCGCYASKVISNNNKVLKRKHGMSTTRIYNTFKHMWDRCTNVNNKHYKDYGGRGINVCDEWKSFDKFWEDMKEGYKHNLSLDRINNDGNYCKENCRWATQTQQGNNTRTNTHITFNGVTLTIAEMARKYNLLPETIMWRMKSGWNLQDVFLKPTRKFKPS